MAASAKPAVSAEPHAEPKWDIPICLTLSSRSLDQSTAILATLTSFILAPLPQLFAHPFAQTSISRSFPSSSDSRSLASAEANASFKPELVGSPTCERDASAVEQRRSAFELQELTSTAVSLRKGSSAKSV